MRVKHRHAVHLTLAIALAGLGLAGCSGGSSGKDADADAAAPGAAGAAKPPVKAKAYDPPTTFGKSVQLPVDEDIKDWGFALRGPTLYHRTSAALDAYDTGSGRRLWSSDIGRKDYYTGKEGQPSDDQTIPPVFAEQDGHTGVLFAYADDTKGSGTTPDRTDVYLRSVDADTGKVSWTARLPAPKGATVSYLEPAVIGAEDGTAVVRVFTDTNPTPSEDGESATTYAVDLKTHRTVWQKEGFSGSALDSGVVVGARLGPEATFQVLTGWNSQKEDLALTGLALADGAQRWKQGGRSGVDIDQVGGGFFIAGSLRDSRTGALVPGGESGDFFHCYYDQKSVVVCDNKEAVHGIDAQTHKVLWTISGNDPSRKKPEVNNAFHGAVYASAGTDGVILDARTGKDRGLYEGASGYVMNEYASVDIDLEVNPATG